jgi:hypothetical protein
MLERLGRHREALSLYVHQLRDLALAEQYCDRVYAGGRARSRRAITRVGLSRAGASIGCCLRLSQRRRVGLGCCWDALLTAARPPLHAGLLAAQQQSRPGGRLGGGGDQQAQGQQGQQRQRRPSSGQGQGQGQQEASGSSAALGSSPGEASAGWAAQGEARLARGARHGSGAELLSKTGSGGAALARLGEVRQAAAIYYDLLNIVLQPHAPCAQQHPHAQQHPQAQARQGQAQQRSAAVPIPGDGAGSRGWRSQPGSGASSPRSSYGQLDAGRSLGADSYMGRAAALGARAGAAGPGSGFGSSAGSARPPAGAAPQRARPQGQGQGASPLAAAAAVMAPDVGGEAGLGPGAGAALPLDSGVWRALAGLVSRKRDRLDPLTVRPCAAAAAAAPACACM